ncbi:MAG: sigma-70 family RNA polymerase sigma factor [Acidobacteria bacterium]|nr:sigma-70 family RNA polymerase sigma factor [Acidobacteriota bacterium]
MSEPADLTGMLLSWTRGDRAALDALMPVVYDELRRIASRYLSRERSDHTLQPTALVHEAYLRLVDEKRVQWQNRAHFLGVASLLMRRILVDHARTHRAGKRGGGVRPVRIDEALAVSGGQDVDILVLDDALTRLAAVDPEQGRLVERRFFGGLSIVETAEVLSISPASVKREWNLAKAWLHREVGRMPPVGD